MKNAVDLLLKVVHTRQQLCSPFDLYSNRCADTFKIMNKKDRMLSYKGPDNPLKRYAFYFHQFIERAHLQTDSSQKNTMKRDAFKKNPFS